MIEEAGLASLASVVREALPKTDRCDQEQRGREQIPRTGHHVRSMRDGRGRRGQKSSAGHISSQGNGQQRRGGFLAGLPRGGHVALHGDGGEQ